MFVVTTITTIIIVITITKASFISITIGLIIITDTNFARDYLHQTI